MNRKQIDENVKRMLYAESMGKCMNPNCMADLFRGTGDIIEKAHIDSYCETEDNSFENLVILCPNCHTDFDKKKHIMQTKLKNGRKYVGKNWMLFLHKN